MSGYSALATPNQWNNYLIGVPPSASSPTVSPQVSATLSAAGTTQGTATPLTAQNTAVTVCASGAGVIATLAYHKVYSRGANPVLLYPPPGAQFDNLAANAPVSIPVNSAVVMVMTSPTQGYVG